MDGAREELLDLLGNIVRGLRDRMARDPYFPQSGRVAVAALIGEIRSTERVIQGRLDQHARADVLRVLREWAEYLGALLPEEERAARERRLRSPELQEELKKWCAEIREPGPDAYDPYCLVLVGLRDEDIEHVARLLGDGYSIRQYWVDGDMAYGPCYRAVSTDYRYEYLWQLPQEELPPADFAYRQIGAEWGYTIARVTVGDEDVPAGALIAYDDRRPRARVYLPSDGARPACRHLGEELDGLGWRSVHLVEV